MFEAARNARNRVVEHVRTHWVACVFALLAGVLVVSPQIVFIVSAGDDYKGLYLMKQEAETHYLARMNEFYDEGKIGNPFLFEYKYAEPFFFSWFGEWIMTLPGRILGISVDDLNLINKFVYPAITFVLLYALFFIVMHNRAWSIAGASFVVVGISWLYFDQVLRFMQIDPAFDQFIWFNRPVNPQLSAPLFFAYLLILYSVDSKRSRQRFLLLGLLYGLSFYIYFYTFTFLTALNVVFITLWFFSGARELARKLSVVSVAALIAGFPAVLGILATMQTPDFAVLSEANSVNTGRHFELSKIGLLVSALFAGLLYRFRKRPEFYLPRKTIIFIGGILLAAFAVINQQLVTGIGMQSGHYHQGFNVPIFAITLVVLGHAAMSAVIRLRPAHAMWMTVFPLVLTILFFMSGTYVQVAAYQHWRPIVLGEQRYMDVFRWLEVHAPKDAVVMANEELSGIIPVFTGQNVMWEKRHIVCCYIIPAERASFNPEAVLTSEDPVGVMRASPYRLDYVLWDRMMDPDWKIDRLGLPLLYEGDGLSLYQVAKATVL